MRKFSGSAKRSQKSKIMQYEIVNLVFYILYIIYSSMMVHFVLFGIVGTFAKKTYPKTNVINRYGLIIPARNEELVVGGLIDSIRANDYPQDKLDIFVIAHNCTDKTAEIARAKGVHVYEYNNPNECTMGYAFKHLFSCIERDFKTSSYDGFFLFNADNTLEPNYFSKMNDAFEYYGKKNVVTSYRNSKNFGSNVMSCLYGIYFLSGCRFEARGRTVCGCSTRVQGTGYVINSNIVKDGWPYVTLTEDWEFSTDQILDGNLIKYCDDAIFYDEQPTDMKIMWRQRVRWSRGHLLVCLARFTDLIKALFSKKTKHKFSVYDIFANILPFCVVITLIFLLHQVILSIGMACDGESAKTILMGTLMEHPWETLIKASPIENVYNWITNDTIESNIKLGWVPWIIRSAIPWYFISLVPSIVIMIADRKRIHNVKWYTKIAACFVWPFFIGLQFLIDFQALFMKNLGWKPIPHKEKSNFEK